MSASVICCSAEPATTRFSGRARLSRLLAGLRGPDWAILIVVSALAVFTPAQLGPSLKFTLDAALHIMPFFIASVAFSSAIRASGADRSVTRVFRGGPARSIAIAAVFGAFSPFCSCGVIPLVAGLLASGVPLAPVMTFWIASPAMDPELFFLIAGTLGVSFATAKTLAVLLIAIAGGILTHVLDKKGYLSSPLRRTVSGCSARVLEERGINWRFWRDAAARADFNKSFIESGATLSRWLLLAYLLESLMVEYVPAESVASWLGGGAGGIVAAATLGAPAYLNSYAAIPLVRGLIDLGMSPAVALAFLLSGTMTSLPAAMAVWATVKRRVFGLYLTITVLGAIASGLVYQALLG